MMLTNREEEVMRWVAEAKTNWEISVILDVSLNTIKFHLKNVYQKLGGVENRWAAVAQWQNMTNLLIPPPPSNRTSPHFDNQRLGQGWRDGISQSGAPIAATCPNCIYAAFRRPTRAPDVALHSDELTRPLPADAGTAP